VLAFVQTAIALIGTLYTYMLSALVGLGANQSAEFGSPGVRSLASEGTVLALVQLAAVVPLVAGGILVLTRRSRAAWLTLLVAFAIQVLIALYWMFRLSGVIGQGFDAATGPLAAFTLVFAAAPLVGVGLLLSGPARRWFPEPAR
jgi:magnesium-transporting ATPase (P-type)